MITVPEAAKLAGKDPETIRRWIRSGRLQARKIGTQHVIEEADLAELIEDEELPGPPEWQTTVHGRPMPNVVRAIRLSRAGR
jgi:excisionase family DNA binding protein